MSETQELNEQLERECYNYPPDLEKMQKLVDMGADVNAVYDDRSESLLGWIIYNYLSEVTIDGFDQMEDSPCQDICEVLCQGKTVNGRDGKYFDSIIRFFFKNGYDIGRKYDTGYSEESFAKDLFGYLPYACNGNEILKTLNYILSHIQSPDELIDTRGELFYQEYRIKADEADNYKNYALCLIKMSDLIEGFVKESGWEDAINNRSSELKRMFDSITRLIIDIGIQLNMEKNDQILMMLCLNTPSKIKRFVDWAKERTVGNEIKSDSIKVLRAATRIGRGIEPLD